MSDLKSNNKSSATARKGTKTVKKVVASINEKEKNIIDYNIRPDLTSGIFGNVDAFTPQGISGWVIDLSQPTMQLNVFAYIADKVVASGVTNLARPDISNLLQSPANCGFLLKWDALALIESIEELADSDLCPIEVKVEGDQRPIFSACSFSVIEIKKILSIPMYIEGTIDEECDSIFLGWATAENELFSKVNIFANDELVTSTVASLYRPDLEANRLNEGYASFVAKVPFMFRGVGDVNVKLEVKGMTLLTGVRRFSPIKILIVSETDNREDASRYYRCDNLRMLLGRSGLNAHLIGMNEFVSGKWSDFDVIIFCRCGADEGIANKISDYKKSFNTKIIYEIDDLVFLPWHTFDFGSVRSGVDDPNNPNLIAMLSNRLRLLTLADGAITTTAKIKEHLVGMGLPTIIVPNMVREQDFKNRHYDENTVLNLLCMSGSPTHYKDFQMIESDLGKFLSLHEKTVKLTLLGRFREDLSILKFKNVNHIPRVSYQKMLHIIDKHDLCIVPLEFTDFNNSKSCLKYIECGARGIPVLASATSDYKRVIRHCENGFIADNWLNSLEFVLENKNILKDVGTTASCEIKSSYCIDFTTIDIKKWLFEEI